MATFCSSDVILQRNHGSIVNPERHVGDLGNVFANPFGVAVVLAATEIASLDPQRLVSSALVKVSTKQGWIQVEILGRVLPKYHGP